MKGKWSRRAPKSIGQRSAVLSKCGRRCFLGPGKTFPICARLGSGSGSGACKIDRRGVQAAYSRAREWAAITGRKKRIIDEGGTVSSEIYRGSSSSEGDSLETQKLNPSRSKSATAAGGRRA